MSEKDQLKLEKAQRLDTDLYEEIEVEKTEDDENITIPYNKFEYFHDVNIPVHVQFSETTKTINEILQLKINDIIYFPNATGTNIKLYAGRQIMAVGEIVMVNEKYGMRVNDIISDKEEH